MSAVTPGEGPETLTRAPPVPAAPDDRVDHIPGGAAATEPARPRSLREEAESDLQRVLWVLVSLSVLVLPVWYLMTWSPPLTDSLPAGVRITDPQALILDEEEEARFDATVFGDLAGREPPTALGDLRLAAQLPTLTERPWLLTGRSELSTNAVHEALDSLRRCSETAGCDPRQGEVLKDALAAVSIQPPDDSGPCNSAPRTGGEGVQVPVGLHAIVLSYLAQCREQARQRFAVFKEKIALNIVSGGMRPPQAAAALVYAGFQEAKLAESPRRPGGAAFLTQIRAIRGQILGTPALNQAWAHGEELPQWGLSMGEIQAEWLMAEARELARQGRGPGLTARLQRSGVLETGVLEQLRNLSTPSPGQGRLKLIWCALSLRAQLADGASDVCLSTLAHAVSLPALHCALVARNAIAAGRWEVNASECGGDRDSAPETSAAIVFEHMAENHRIWNEVLQRYLHGGIDADERARLRGYLSSYSSLSHNTLMWFWVQHPRPFMLLVAAFCLLLVGWISWLWAHLVRRRSLHRFLPAPLALD